MRPDIAIREYSEEIRKTAARHGVGRVYVFGSTARGTATERSDLDLLIEVIGKTTPWFPGGLIADLESLLGCRVEVVETAALRPELRDAILHEAKPL